MLELTKFAINVKKIIVGQIETDADDVLAFIEERVKDYDVSKYKGSAEDAKKDRAELNKADTKMKDMTEEITAQWNEPIRSTLDKLKTGRSLIKAASIACDKLVKAKEAEEDELKRGQIRVYFGTKMFDLVKLEHEKFFDLKWLNKGATLKTVYAEIDAKIEAIYSALKTLEAFGEDAGTLKALYIDTLDIGRALDQGNRLKANRERLAAEAAARPAREHQEAMNTQQAELAKEEIKAQAEKPIASLASSALGIKPDDDPMVTKIIEFTAPQSKLFALMQYMIDNGITYKKIEATA